MQSPSTPGNLYDLAERAAASDLARSLADRLQRLVPGALRDGPFARTLRGHRFGHAVHPVLTDFPLGLWMSSTVLDVLGMGRWRQASLVLGGAGLAAAVPTVATGLAEWEHVEATDRRTVALHAAVNGAAAMLYGVSLVATLRRRHGAAALSAVGGGLVATIGGYLGGHLSLARSVGQGRR